MCTAIVLRSGNGEVLMGRTMDFSHLLAPQVYRISAGNWWRSRLSGEDWQMQYAVMGVGQEIPELTLADGVNEAGLGVAMLYFAGCAEYDSYAGSDSEQTWLAATEVVLFLLGMCGGIDEALRVFSAIRIAGIADSVTGGVAPLHWLLADSTGRSVTVEKTENGLQIYENQIGVLANSPDFAWHMTNLRNYRNVVSEPGTSTEWAPGVTLSAFGQGAGSFGLPGDFTSPGRFVRAAWLKSHTVGLQTGADALRAGFYILGNVSIPKGCVVTPNKTLDYTQYTVFYNLTTQRYEFRT